MKSFDSLMRRLFPRQYCIRGLRRTENENKRRLKAAEHLSADERYNLKHELEYDLWEWDDWPTVLTECIPCYHVRRDFYNLAEVGNARIHDGSTGAHRRAASGRDGHPRDESDRRGNRVRSQAGVAILDIICLKICCAIGELSCRTAEDLTASNASPTAASMSR